MADTNLVGIARIYQAVEALFGKLQVCRAMHNVLSSCVPAIQAETATVGSAAVKQERCRHSAQPYERATAGKLLH